MRVVYRKKIPFSNQPLDKRRVLEIIEFVLQKEGVKNVENKDGVVSFATFSLFRYLTWHKFSLMDYGNYSVNIDKSSISIKYQFLSWRIWVLTLILFFFTLSSSDLIFALSCFLIFQVILSVFLILVQRSFFKTMITKIRTEVSDKG